MAFKGTGLSPSHAFMMVLINEQPGITQKELSEHLALAPSTLTRFADKLVYNGFIEREQKGKIVRIYPTREGAELTPAIENAWKTLHDQYSKVLGTEKGHELTSLIDQANQQLENLGEFSR